MPGGCICVQFRNDFDSGNCCKGAWRQEPKGRARFQPRHLLTSKAKQPLALLLLHLGDCIATPDRSRVVVAYPRLRYRHDANHTRIDISFPERQSNLSAPLTPGAERRQRQHVIRRPSPTLSFKGIHSSMKACSPNLPGCCPASGESAHYEG